MILTEESFHGSGVAGNWAAAMGKSINFTITVGDVNRPPVLDPISAKSVAENQLLEFTITATDPDGDSLIYSAGNLPPGASFDPATGTFSWTPGYGDAGNYTNVLFTVTDTGTPTASDSEAITITVGELSITSRAIMDLNFEEGSNNIAFDTSGNNNNGTINGAVYTTDSAVGSYTLNFDGENDRVVCQGNQSLQPDNISVALWVKHLDDMRFSNYGGVIQGAYGDGYNTGFRILDIENKPFVQINFGDSTPIRILGETFTQNEWFHIVLTYDHQNIKLYDNGKLFAEKPETRDINWSNNNPNLYIGWTQWYFKGVIDKVMLFDFALNSQDVQELYNTSNPGNNPP